MSTPFSYSIGVSWTGEARYTMLLWGKNQQQFLLKMGTVPFYESSRLGVTLLAVTDCEQQGLPFSTDVLTPERLAEYMQMLSFDKFNGALANLEVETYFLFLNIHQDSSIPEYSEIIQCELLCSNSVGLERVRTVVLLVTEAYDIQIEGLGLKYLVSEIANTVLKEPKVGKVAATCRHACCLPRPFRHQGGFNLSPHPLPLGPIEQIQDFPKFRPPPTARGW